MSGSESGGSYGPLATIMPPICSLAVWVDTGCS